MTVSVLLVLFYQEQICVQILGWPWIQLLPNLGDGFSGQESAEKKFESTLEKESVPLCSVASPTIAIAIKNKKN